MILINNNNTKLSKFYSTHLKYHNTVINMYVHNLKKKYEDIAYLCKIF